MSDDETRPIEPEASAPPPQADSPEPHEAQPQPSAPTYASGQPAYAMPQPAPLPAGYPAYGGQQRPRFADQVLGMRAVVAVALACLIIGALSGWILGHAAGTDGERFGGPGGFVQQRGTFPGGPDGFPHGPNGAPDPNGSGQSGR
jgi:hypothetical protein